MTDNTEPAITTVEEWEHERELEIEAEYLLNLQRIVDENANSDCSAVQVWDL